MTKTQQYKHLADKVAVEIMYLQDALYVDCHNDELRQDIADLEEDYQYLRNQYEKYRVS